MIQEETKKGPWTKQEDLQLVCFVGLFGDRRWDFIAKVSGLKRAGKSCRLRWVNYLHPGLKRGKMTLHEEQLILKLHSEWGNRWSRIARRLPGRTDNEIKNYWRTHTRKQAQESKRTSTPSSPSTSNHSSSLSNNQVVISKATENTITSFQGMGGSDMSALQGKKYQDQMNGTERKEEFYSMDAIWQEITSEEEPIKPVNDGYFTEGSNFSCPPMASASLEFYPDMVWKLEEEQGKIFPSHHDQFLPYYVQENISWP